jgi:hypothetical protein
MLGNPRTYVEPFAGSLAVLLARPHHRPSHIEVVNDLDGMLVNVWRSIKHSPAETAAHCDDPVSELDAVARELWLVNNTGDYPSRLGGNPKWHDPRAAGYWLYVQCLRIGVLGEVGPWHSVDGLLVDRRDGTPVTGNGIRKQIPQAQKLGVLWPGVDTVQWLRRLSRRLATVSMVCGDWRRPLSDAYLRQTPTAVFLDPPYSVGADRYTAGKQPLQTEVTEWALSADPELRIVIAGYDGEYPALETAGWTVHQSRSTSNGAGRLGGKQAYRERLWASPNCHTPHLHLF